ncbi:MAG: serine/threonine-protein kinase [Deltaproteobacteria bacterium]|nr:serine/threonine-protein kinase [Deltaproteobacteria bacterium]
MSGVDYSGRTLEGKYRLVRILGKGGMGSVYLGEHVIIGKLVAVKFLHAEYASNEEVVKRFYREAQAAAAIGHDAIIDVMDVGVSPEGEPYLVMEYLEGESLAALLTRVGRMDVPEACGILEPVLLALHAAHGKGIVHRDLKPENIFLVHREGEAPRIKVIDFGISKFAKGPGGTKLTQTGSVMGTPAYMSPEQARGASDVDQRSDLYSIGVIFYEMLTGVLPFVGENFTAMIISILTSDPRPPLEVCPSFPKEAESVLLRSLVKTPSGRYQNALEMLEALKGLGGFQQRQERLSRFTSGAVKKTFASGDLGGEEPKVVGGSGVAANILSQVARAGTPAGWAGTRPAALPGKKPVALIAGAAILAAAAGVAGVVLVLGGKAEVKAEAGAVPVAMPAAPAGAPTPGEKTVATVSIKVEGAPQGARILYDDMPVPQNPFKVQKSDAMMSLRVEAQGFEPAAVVVVPSEDRVVTVALAAAVGKPVETGSKGGFHGKRGPRGEAKRETAPAAPTAPVAPVAAPQPAPEKRKNLVEGARGTKIKTDFE